MARTRRRDIKKREAEFLTPPSKKLTTPIPELTPPLPGDIWRAPAHIWRAIFLTPHSKTLTTPISRMTPPSPADMWRAPAHIWRAIGCTPPPKFLRHPFPDLQQGLKNSTLDFFLLIRLPFPHTCIHPLFRFSASRVRTVRKLWKRRRSVSFSYSLFSFPFASFV
jgi:hypothetical protein